MDTTGLFESQSSVLSSAPHPTDTLLRFHLQVIKYADLLDGVSSKGFARS